MPVKPADPSTTYDQEACCVFIFDKLESSERGLVKILEEDKEFLPTIKAFYSWLDRDDKKVLEGNPEAKFFSRRYEAARKKQAHIMVERMLDIAEEAPGTTRFGEVDSGDVRNRDLKIKTRQWIASKINKAYSDRQVLAGDDEAPLTGKKADLSKLTDAELATLLELQRKIES